MEKYYYPTVEDFYIGYEFEHEDFGRPDNNSDDPHGKWWISSKIESIGSKDSFHAKLPNGNYAPITELAVIESIDDVYVRQTLRVPYLNREQIVNEDWVYEGGMFNKDSRQDYLLGIYKLEYWELNQNSKIYRKNHVRDGSGRFDWYRIFEGKIPTINELRTLMRWFKIK